MSGHSHWSTIKRAKQAKDKQRGQIFSKISRMISVAAREKGGDPETNPQLRQALEKAKEFNVPKDNIERAIKRGTGELKGVKFEKVLYEAYGPGNIAIIIEGITDNKNRAKNEISQILNQYNGKLADPGSVKWMFERKGCITLRIAHCSHTANQYEYTNKNKEELELKAIEAGAEDIRWQGNLLEIYTEVEDLEKVKEKLENQEVKIESATLDWVAKQEIEVNEKDKIVCQKLFEALDENEAVQEIYSNLKD